MLVINEQRTETQGAEESSANDAGAQEIGVKMDSEYFGNAYQRGFKLTVRFLISRGVSQDAAFDTAQAAWTRGWERREQLRHPNLVFTWTNTIALNMYRSLLRRDTQNEPLAELPGPSGVDVAAIDVERILSECKPKDRIVLEDHYIRGYKVHEIAKERGWSKRAVLVRLLRARKKTRERLTSPKNAHRLALAEETQRALASAVEVETRAA